MPDRVRIREAKPDDTLRILNVLKAALGEKRLLRRTPELFAWKHTANPFGKSIVLVAESGERLAGVRTLMRWELDTPSGQVIRCVRAVDTATHPDFSRMGIFKRLTLEALDIAREDGVHLVFNTPNQYSAPGYLKMGWDEVGWLGAMVRPRLGRALAANEDSVPSLERAIPGVVPFEPVEYADRAPLGLRTRRTSEFQSWRFTGHPTASYGWVQDRAEGGAVVRASTRNGRTETIIADLLAGGGVHSIRQTAHMSRCRYVAAWFSSGSPERKKAIRAGVLPVPGVKTLRLVAKPLTEFDIDVLDLGSWDLATSDLELL